MSKKDQQKLRMIIDKKTRFVIMEGMKIKKIFWSLSDARDYLDHQENCDAQTTGS